MRFVDHDQRITREELRQLAGEKYGDIVKVVVDVARGMMVVGCDMHYDGEHDFLEQGSQQADLWGINLKPGLPHPDWIEYDSMINMRPRQENRSRGVENQEIRDRIVQIVAELTR